MSDPTQLSMPLSGIRRDAARPMWFGLTIDHRTLFDALQDEWLRPPDSAAARVLGVGSYADTRQLRDGLNIIVAGLQIDPAQLPHIDVLVQRSRRWLVMAVDEVRTDDDAVLWPGVLPAFAISKIVVSTREEQVRLVGLARHVSNIPLPEVSIEIVRSGESRGQFADLPVEVPTGIDLPTGLDAVRGATAMAVWSVPKIDPWLDILAASLSPESHGLPELASHVATPWWARPPWARGVMPDILDDVQAALWNGAVDELWERHGDTGTDVTEIVRDITGRALAHAPAGSAELEAWARETLSVLRAEAPMRLEEWKISPMGKALQLLLLRSEPDRFATWFDDLPAMPPAVWWSAATLCGLLHGYRRLNVRYRGDRSQRKVLAIHALHVCSADSTKPRWPLPNGGVKWRREAGTIAFAWGSERVGRKSEHARGRWYVADLEDLRVRHAAEEMARRHRWPCVNRFATVVDGDLELSGTGTAEVTTTAERRIAVHGKLRMRLPPSTQIEETLDALSFRRCIATEGADAAAIPDPPGVAASPEPPVPGLVYVPQFLSEAEEAELVSTIDRAEWRTELRRRVQHYGWRYDYKARQVDPSMRLGPLPAWATSLAERLVAKKLVPNVADQVIVNEYVEKQGITKHVDCVPCFADGVAMISLLESWEMIFSEERGHHRKVGRVLERRSVTVLTGVARYDWTHEIPKRVSESNGLRRGRRLSITFRKVLPYVEPRRTRKVSRTLRQRR